MQETRPDKLSDVAEEDITLHAAPTVVDLPVEDTTGATPADEQTTEETPAPPRLPYRRRRVGLPTPMFILVIALVVLLIGSGFALIIFAATTQYRSALSVATTTANNATRQALQTQQAQQRATTQAQNALNTAQANIEASATAQAGTQEQATAAVEQATATAQALTDFYLQSTSGVPVFDDPLSGNTGSGAWDEGNPSTGTGCIFSDNVYHVQEAQNGNFQPCIAQSTRFSSFAYQVHVTIKQGSQGQVGLLFRVDTTNNAYYFFHISSDGTYALDLYTGENQGQTLQQGSNSAIVTGLNHDNQIAVIANSDLLYLYANGTYLATVADSRLSAGKIGLGVVSKNSPVDAEFTDAQVWQLDQQMSNNGIDDTPTPEDTATATETATETDTMP